MKWRWRQAGEDRLNLVQGASGFEYGEFTEGGRHGRHARDMGGAQL